VNEIVDLREKIAVWTLPHQKHPQLLVKKPDANEWDSIAILKVPIHEFWEKLGQGLGITFVSKDEEEK